MSVLELPVVAALATVTDSAVATPFSISVNVRLFPDPGAAVSSTYRFFIFPATAIGIHLCASVVLSPEEPLIGPYLVEVVPKLSPVPSTPPNSMLWQTVPASYSTAYVSPTPA